MCFHYKVYYDSLFYSNRFLRYLKSLFINPGVILRSDIVYVCTLNVDINIFYELLWAKIFQKKVLVDFYVSVYDTVVLDRKWFKQGSLLAKLARLCDKLFLYLGDKLIFLSNTEREYYIRLSGISKEIDSCVIPLGVDPKAEVHANFFKGSRDSLNICWWGSYQPLHGLQKVLEAVKIVKERGLPIHWFFFGDDSEKGKKYVKFAEELDILDVCEFHDDYTFSNGRLEKFLIENCDVALSHFGDSQKAQNVLPNKFLDACSMKCVVLTGKSDSLEECFGTESVFSCKRAAADIANSVLQIYFYDKNILQERVEQAYHCFCQKFTVQVLMAQFKSVLDEIGPKAKTVK